MDIMSNQCFIVNKFQQNLRIEVRICLKDTLYINQIYRFARQLQKCKRKKKINVKLFQLVK